MGDVIQLRRTKGWRKPEGVVVVARPSRWGNPFPFGVVATRQEAVDLYRGWLRTGEVPPPWMFSAESIEPRRQWILDHLHELRGKTLACWCPQPGPCHAYVLAELTESGAVGSPPEVAR